MSHSQILDNVVDKQSGLFYQSVFAEENTFFVTDAFGRQGIMFVCGKSLEHSLVFVIKVRSQP